MTERTWDVFSPAWAGAWGPGIERDDIIVEAPSRREAIRLAGLEMLSSPYYRWCKDNRADGSPPWKGLKARELRPPTEAELCFAALADPYGAEWEVAAVDDWDNL